MGIFGDMEPYRAFSLVVYGPLPHGMFQAKPLRQWSLVGLFFLIFNCFGKIRPGTHQTLGLIELKNRPNSSFGARTSRTYKANRPLYRLLARDNAPLRVRLW
jgi:hypothetical protein